MVFGRNARPPTPSSRASAPSQKYSARWVLEGDIRGCFDNISHPWMIFNMITIKGIYGREMYETRYKMTVSQVVDVLPDRPRTVVEHATQDAT